MGKLVTVVGNSGAGKTTLVRRLCAVAPLQAALEQHRERPFQRLFADNLARYGLANQVDYLLLRGEQERAARSGAGIAIHDGGLDLDFHAFARLFWRRGYLSDAEFGLCERLYSTLRACLPSADLVVYLTVPVELAAQRYRERNRTLEITRLEDLALLDHLIEDWVTTLPPERVLRLDAAAPDFGSDRNIAEIAANVLLRIAA
jgi:deoxyadenosine/deoxycytidine kinase